MSRHETPISKEILLEFGSRPTIRLWRINTGVFNNEAGVRCIRSAPTGHADLAGILHGGFALYIETKSATGKQRIEQRQFQSVVESLGGCYILARSIEDVERGLERFYGGKNAE